MKEERSRTLLINGLETGSFVKLKANRDGSFSLILHRGQQLQYMDSIRSTHGERILRDAIIPMGLTDTRIVTSAIYVGRTGVFPTTPESLFTFDYTTPIDHLPRRLLVTRTIAEYTAQMNRKPFIMFHVQGSTLRVRVHRNDMEAFHEFVRDWMEIHHRRLVASPAKKKEAVHA